MASFAQSEAQWIEFCPGDLTVKTKKGSGLPSRAGMVYGFIAVRWKRKVEENIVNANFKAMLPFRGW